MSMSQGILATQPTAIEPLLRVQRYRLRFRERDSHRESSLLSPKAGYLGSAWRGTFGHSLKQAVCVTGLADCGECALLGSCAYPRLFESRTPASAEKLTRYPKTPNPYVLEPADTHFDSREHTLNLGLALFGRADDDIPTIVRALELAGRQGITARRVELELVEVQAERDGDDGPAWNPIRAHGGGLRPATPQQRPTPPVPDAVRVRLISPLRIRRDERLVQPAGFHFRAFAANLLRRISLLTYFFGDAPLETDFAALLRRAEDVPTTNQNLRWQDWTRHSTRQNAKIRMGGLLGTFEVHAPELALFWPCLWLGQWTHIGKGCTMGLGRYVLEPLPGGEKWPTPGRL